MYKERIKTIRKNLNLSVAKMAERIQIPARTITGYERGERTPSIEFVAQCCNILNINANWFVTGNGEMFNKKQTQFEDSKEETKQIVLQILKEKGLLSDEIN